MKTENTVQQVAEKWNERILTLTEDQAIALDSLSQQVMVEIILAAPFNLIANMADKVWPQGLAKEPWMLGLIADMTKTREGVEAVIRE